MKSVKSSVDILEGLSTGFNMGISAPHLIHKWFTGHSRWPQSPLFMRKPTVTFVKVTAVFCVPDALACCRNLWRDLKILVPLRTAVLQEPSKSYANRRGRSGIVQLSRNRGN